MTSQPTIPSPGSRSARLPAASSSHLEFASGVLAARTSHASTNRHSHASRRSGQPLPENNGRGNEERPLINERVRRSPERKKHGNGEHDSNRRAGSPRQRHAAATIMGRHRRERQTPDRGRTDARQQQRPKRPRRLLVPPHLAAIAEIRPEVNSTNAHDASGSAIQLIAARIAPMTATPAQHAAYFRGAKPPPDEQPDQQLRLEPEQSRDAARPRSVDSGLSNRYTPAKTPRLRSEF